MVRLTATPSLKPNCALQIGSALLGTNVKGYAYGIKHAARAMLSQKAGAIVNIASTSAYVAQPGFVPYSTSKGAILQLSRCCALDLGSHGIRFGLFHPALG